MITLYVLVGEHGDVGLVVPTEGGVGQVDVGISVTTFVQAVQHPHPYGLV